MYSVFSSVVAFTTYLPGSVGAVVEYSESASRSSLYSSFTFFPLTAVAVAVVGLPSYSLFDTLIVIESAFGSGVGVGSVVGVVSVLLSPLLFTIVTSPQATNVVIERAANAKPIKYFFFFIIPPVNALSTVSFYHKRLKNYIILSNKKNKGYIVKKSVFLWLL